MTTARKTAQDIADWIAGPKWAEWEIKDMETAIQTAIDKETKHLRQLIAVLLVLICIIIICTCF